MKLVIPMVTILREAWVALEKRGTILLIHICVAYILWSTIGHALNLEEVEGWK